jgi:hypothetical protein
MKGQREPACDSRSGINVDRRTFMGTMACAGAGFDLPITTDQLLGA